MKSLYLSIKKQEMILLENKQVIKKYPISSSKYGLGFEKGSFKTPTGNFIIGEKIGDDHPMYTIFKSRIPSGIWNQVINEDDLVLSRILWLVGTDLENINTKDRYIYIHGTTEEYLIGTPASHGCIRMKNTDIVEFYDLVEVGTPIIIENK